MTIVGRSKIDHPSIGTAGGSALHASIETIYTNIGDDLAGRFDTFASVANSTVSTIDHNFGVTFDDLRVLIYTGTHPNLTRVTDPVVSGWTIAATVGFEKTKVDVTTPSSGGPHTFAVFITQGKEVDASTTAGGVVSTGTQTFAGAKTWNDVQTFKANSGADSAGSYDTSYQWTIGRSTSNDAIAHTIYGSASFGTAIPSYSSSTTRYIGNKFASLLFRLGSTATTGFRAQAGAYFNGTTNLLTTLNQTASRLVLNTDTVATGIAYQIDVDANISHAADAATSFVTAHQITFQGIHAIGPSSGLGTGSAAYHLAYGTTVSRMTSSAGSGAFSGRTALFVGANEYLDSAGTQKAITTGGATWAEFTTSAAADSTVVYALKTNTTSQTADIALSGTNVTLFQVTAAGAITGGPSSGLTSSHILRSGAATNTPTLDIISTVTGASPSIRLNPNSTADYGDFLNGGTTGYRWKSGANAVLLTLANAGDLTVGPAASTNVNLKVNGSGAFGASSSFNFTSSNSVEAGQSSIYGDANASYFSHNVYYATGWKSASNVHHNQISFDSSGNFNINYAAASTAGSAITWTTIATGTSAGSFTFGATSGSSTHTLQNDSGTTVVIKRTTSGRPSLVFKTSDNTTRGFFGCDSSGFAWVDSSGSFTNLAITDAGALTLGRDGTNQTHLLNGLSIHRGYVSGGSVNHLFQNRDAANSAGGSCYVKIESFTSDAGITFAPSSTSQWTLFANASNAPVNGLVFSQSTNGNVGYIATSGDWYLGNTSLALVHTLASNRAAATSGTAPCTIVSSGSASGQYFLECFYSTSTSAGGIQRNALTQAVQFFNSSDRRIKTNFGEFDSQLEKLCQIKLRSFGFKHDSSAKGYGPIAQELLEIYPDKVNKTDDGVGDELPDDIKPWSIGNDWSYELIKAVQELKALNDALMAKVAALES